MSVEGYAQARLAGGGPLAGGGSGASAGTLAPGTYAAAARDALSAEEEAFLAQGHDEDALLATIQQYQRIVDDYGAVDNKARRQAAAQAAALRRAALRAPSAPPITQTLAAPSPSCAGCGCWRRQGQGGRRRCSGQAGHAARRNAEDRRRRCGL